MLNQLGSASSTTLNNLRTVRAQIKFAHFPALPCVDPPTPGFTTANDITLCAGQSLQLGLSGASYGLGLTHQWEMSVDSVNWAPIAGANSAFYTTTQTVTTAFYRCQITCGNSTQPSTPVKVVAQVIPFGGAFTVNAALPSSSTNFQSLSEALTAINCAGISAPVTLGLAPGLIRVIMSSVIMLAALTV